jgi:glycosyltransferase involved in cell wall biosynthesis
MDNLHVLVMPSGYPSRANPVRGIFYQDQVRALAGAGVRVGVAYPDLRSLRTFTPTALVDNHFQFVTELDGRSATLRWNAWRIPGTRLQGRLFTKAAMELFDRYSMRNGEPDVLHAHSAVWGGLAARAIAIRKGIPYVVTEHSSVIGRAVLPSWMVAEVEKCYADATEVLTVSDALGKDLRAYLRGRKYLVTPNVVDTTFFNPPVAQRPTHPFTYLAVANLVPTKGLSTLVRAFARFHADAKVVLRIGGDGPDRRALASLVEQLGQAHRVQLLGRLTREQVRAEMWRANVFVVASRYETFGVVALEALATGLPIVTTRCGGTPEIVPANAAVLAEPDDAKSLHGALAHSLGSYSSLALAAGVARSQVVGQFGPAAVAEALMRVYTQQVKAAT